MIKLEDTEHIVIEVQKHWFILLGEELFLIGLIFVPILFYIAFQFLNAQELITSSVGIGNLIGALSAAWFLFIWVTFFIIWTDYYLDVLILTDKKVIDIDQKGLFNRDISTCRLDRIQDVKIEINGMIATFLRFGTITIQTAGEEDNFIIHGLRNPVETKEAILHQASMHARV